VIRAFRFDRGLKARCATIRDTHRFLASGPDEERAVVGGFCETLCASGGYMSALLAERRLDRTIRVVSRTGPPIDVAPESLPTWNDPSGSPSAFPLKKGRACACPVPVDGGLPMTLVLATEAGDAFGPEELADLAAVASRLGGVISRVRLAARFDSLKKVYDDQSDLLEAEREFSARLLELVPVPIVQLGPEGEIRLFNRAVESLTGYRASDVLNRRMADVLLPEPDRSAFRRMLVELFIGRRPGDDSFPLLTRAGGPVRIRWEFSPIRDAFSGKVASVLACGEATNVSDAP
jgi:PAS domain S-box-containing protein